MSSTKITLIRKNYKNDDVILIRFRYREELIDLVKTLPRRRWSATLKSWLVPYSEQMVRRIKTTFKGHYLENRTSRTIAESF